MPSYIPTPGLLRARHILITGAGDGIGRAVALACAKHGAHVLLHGRTEKKLEQVYDEIERQGCPKAAILPLDLFSARPEHFESTANSIESEFGHLDGLLHNAADAGTLTPMEHYPPDTWNRVLQVNLTAAALLTRACLPLLRRSADASIVFTTADVGREGRAYWGAYGVAAFGLEGLRQILAAELSTDTRIRVNSLDPGKVRTRMRARQYPGENLDARRAPEAITPAYLYLLGPDSRGINGQALRADDFIAATVKAHSER